LVAEGRARRAALAAMLRELATIWRSLKAFPMLCSAAVDSALGEWGEAAVGEVVN
jgi:hypothetical protein